MLQPLKKADEELEKQKITHQHIRDIADHVPASEAANELSSHVHPKHANYDDEKVDSDTVHRLIDHLPSHTLKTVHERMKFHYRDQHGKDWPH
jgi:hypothetical protein